MAMRKSTINWIKSAEYDYKTAENLFKVKRYVYVIFMCHLSIEKILKAVISEETNKLPPYTHNLLYLTELGGVKFTSDMQEFVKVINDKSVPTRYPENITDLIKIITPALSKDYLKKTKGVVLWLKQNLKIVKSNRQ